MLLCVSIFEVGPEYGIDPIWGHQCSAPHDKFQIVEVPLDAPEDAEVIADVPLGLAGEGHHAACHDIGVLMNRDKQFAVCAAGQGVLFDISDPAAGSPARLRRGRNRALALGRPLVGRLRRRVGLGAGHRGHAALPGHR